MTSSKKHWVMLKLTALDVGSQLDMPLSVLFTSYMSPTDSVDRCLDICQIVHHSLSQCPALVEVPVDIASFTGGSGDSSVLAVDGQTDQVKMPFYTLII